MNAHAFGLRHRYAEKVKKNIAKYVLNLCRFSCSPSKAQNRTVCVGMQRCTIMRVLDLANMIEW